MGVNIDRETVLPLIYGEVAQGRPLYLVLKDEGMPGSSTFWRWHMEDEVVRDNLACARLNGVEAHLDEALAIADDKANDTVVDKDGNERANTEWISRAKLRVETRMKLAAMIAPRKYGPKVDVNANVSGALTITINKPGAD